MIKGPFLNIPNCCFRAILWACIFILSAISNSYAQTDQEAPITQSQNAIEKAQDTPQSPHVKDISDQYMKPMPEFEKMDEKDFMDATQPFHELPYDEEALEFNIRLPKDWDISNQINAASFSLNEKIFTNLNMFKSKPRMGGQSTIELKAMNLDFYLTAKQWYMNYLLSNGYTTEAMVADNDQKIESLRVITEQDITYIQRTVVYINGDKVIALEYSIPSMFWEQEKSIQASIIDTFQLVNPKPIEKVKMLDFQFLDIAEMSYPENWKLLARPMRSVDQMNIKILNVQDASDSVKSSQGNIDITLISNRQANSIIEEISTYKKELESTGVLVGRKLENVEDINYFDTPAFVATEVYEGIDSKNDAAQYELWFTVMTSGNYFYFFTLLTPSRNTSYIPWTYNTRGYKMILETFLPQSGAYLDYDQ